MADKAAPSPQKITGHLIAPFRSAAFLAALQLELFTFLGKNAFTGEDLSAAIGVSPQRLTPILNVLVLDGLLLRDGERYTNGEEARHYLIKGETSYIGGLHEIYADLYKAMLRTAESIRSDHPAAEHDFGRMGDAELTAFFRGLHGLGVVQGRDLARQHDFGRFNTLVDVGGGSGSIAIGACEACPGLHATILELDRVVPITQQFVSETQIAHRIGVAACDITNQAPPLKTFDIAVLRSVIQVLSPAQAAKAVENVGKCLRSGGEIYIIGYVLDDTRSIPWEAAAYDVVFINIYRSGQSYTDRQYREWLEAGGFTKTERKLLSTNMSLIKAEKS